MKQLAVLAGCAVFLSGLAGCQRPAQTTPPVSGVEVIVEGGGEFPQFLVGTWKADKHGWEFVFEPDGTISSAVIDSGFIRVTPGKRVATIPMKEEGKGIYKLGQWTVQYSPDDRELAVEVVVDHFHIDLGPHALEGHSTDWFIGPVSEDSQIWEAQWFNFPKYIALTPEPNELSVDPNDNPRDTLVFRKQPKTN